MYLLLGPALRLVLGPAYLGALHVAVLHQRSSTNGGGLVEGNLLVLDEAVLPEVLLAVLLLLGLIVGDIGGMAPPVVGVVALHHIVVLSLLDHLHLVDTPLPVVARSGSRNSREAHIDIRTLSVVSASKSRHMSGSMVVVVVLLLPGGFLVEGEGVGERALVRSLMQVATQLSSSKRSRG